MLDDTGLRVMRHRAAGLCCAQIMVSLALEDMGRDNPGLVRAAHGLCFGLGDFRGPCGALGGAALALGLYAGKGGPHEEPNPRLACMLEDLGEWFRATMAERHGGSSCGEILGADLAGLDCAGELPAPDPARCGVAVVDTYARLQAILTDYGLDPGRPRD